MQESTSDKYFDLHTTGIGYLNRIREVTPQRGQPFLAVDINALHGHADRVEYTRFDCRVSGRSAQEVLNQLRPAIEAERRVLIGFKISDLYAEPFTYTQGDRQGQTGISLKARLLKITWAKVDGEPVALPSRTEDQAA